jgi:hypothetical protein
MSLIDVIGHRATGDLVHAQELLRDMALSAVLGKRRILSEGLR